MVMLDRKTVSIPRACELVGVSRRTIYNWIAGGKVEVRADRRWIGPDLCRHAVARAGAGED